MPTHKALLLPSKQAQWHVGENTIPAPGATDVLVKLISVGLNPGDWKNREHGTFIAEYPYIAGKDGAGEVVETGSEVSNVVVGDRIFFQGWHHNDLATFQQYCLVPAELTAKIPANISLDQAASIPLGLATVVTGLWGHNPGRSLGWPAPWEDDGFTKFVGKAAFIIGGASSVGQYAIQMARLSGFSPIITTASLHNAPLLHSLGALHVLDRALPPEQILSQLHTLTSDPENSKSSPIELVYDAVSSSETLQLGYAALARGGAMLHVLPGEIPGWKDGGGKTVVMVFGGLGIPENRAFGVQLFSRLTEWLEKGVLVPNRVEVMQGGLAGIPVGLERLRANKVSGVKLVARPQETP